MLILKAGTINVIRQSAENRSTNSKICIFDDATAMKQAVEGCDEPQGRHVQQKRKMQRQQRQGC